MATSFFTKIADHWVWYALLATLIACAYVANEDASEQEGIVQPSKVISQKNRHQKNTLGLRHDAATNADFAKGGRRELNTQHQKNLFKVLKSVEPAKPQPTVNLAQVPKQEEFVVPPIPYEYVGKMDDPSKGTVIYLVANDKLYTVVKGEKVDAFWRFDEEFILSLQFTYLPKNMTKVLLKNPQGI